MKTTLNIIKTSPKNWNRFSDIPVGTYFTFRSSTSDGPVPSIRDRIYFKLNSRPRQNALNLSSGEVSYFFTANEDARSFTFYPVKNIEVQGDVEV